MNRKDFIKKTLAGGAMVTLGAKGITAATKDNDQTKDRVGHNHLPNKESKTMNSVLHKANTRGAADHGWLQSRHTFSFANYHHPERMNFGLLRVLNDDIVDAGRGFGTHPHRDMEIISIPLEGDLEHKDSMGNVAVIKQGDVQVLSAGTGMTHSEYNKNTDQLVKFLQIWIFPDKRGVTPRYDQITLDMDDRKNKLQQILSPNADDAGVWIHQQAWFNMTTLGKGKKVDYSLHRPEHNGVYAFILSGDVTINGQQLNPRDGYGMWNLNEVNITADSDAEVLLMEVPMS